MYSMESLKIKKKVYKKNARFFTESKSFEIVEVAS